MYTAPNLNPHFLLTTHRRSLNDDLNFENNFSINSNFDKPNFSPINNHPPVVPPPTQPSKSPLGLTDHHHHHHPTKPISFLNVDNLNLQRPRARSTSFRPNLKQMFFDLSHSKLSNNPNLESNLYNDNINNNYHHHHNRLSLHQHHYYHQNQDHDECDNFVSTSLGQSLNDASDDQEADIDSIFTLTKDHSDSNDQNFDLNHSTSFPSITMSNSPSIQESVLALFSKVGSDNFLFIIFYTLVLK